MMRVAYIDHVSKLSGGELALLRLIRAMPEVDAFVILAEQGPLVQALLDAGATVYVVPMIARTRELRKGSVGHIDTARAILDTMRYVIRVAAVIRKIDPDIVHTNSLKAGVYGTLAARLTSRPVVWHLRDRLERDYLPRIGILLVRVVTRLSSIVVCNSEATRQSLGDAVPSVVIHSPIDIRPSSRERDRSLTPEDPAVIGMVGRLAHWKGQHVFLQAFADSFPDGSERARVIGSAMFGSEEQEYATSLLALVAQLGIASRVDFLGHITDVQLALDELDVLVHASVVPEPFGQVVAEGMAAGLPVIATTGGGPSEFISDGVDGLLYPPGDVGALARLLRSVVTDPSARVSLGARAEKSAGRFSGAVIAAAMREVYADVAEGPGCMPVRSQNPRPPARAAGRSRRR